jgi:hypothetical protein
MSLQDRDRRALALLAVAALLAAIIYFWPQPSPDVVTSDAATPEAARARLLKLRQVAATIPGKQKVLEGVRAQLAGREKGILAADTAAQAQAQLMQTVTKVAHAQQPPIDFVQRDLGPIQPLGKDYGEALVSVSFNCQIDQLVNLLADLSGQPELIATHELQVRAADMPRKTVGVRLTVSGVLPRKLVPERKGALLF